VGARPDRNGFGCDVSPCIGHIPLQRRTAAYLPAGDAVLHLFDVRIFFYFSDEKKQNTVFVKKKLKWLYKV
jgi:hypothetical protein